MSLMTVDAAEPKATTPPIETPSGSNALDGSPYKVQLENVKKFQRVVEESAAQRHHEQSEDMAGKFVGLMPPQTFMAEFMEPAVPLPEQGIPTADFSAIMGRKVRKEEHMYLPFVGLVPVLPIASVDTFLFRPKAFTRRA